MADANIIIGGLAFDIVAGDEGMTNVAKTLEEAIPYIGDANQPNLERCILERIEELLSEETLKEDVASSLTYLAKRKAIRSRITGLTKRLGEEVTRFQKEKVTKAVALALNEAVVILQRDMVDEACFTLLVRKDFSTSNMLDKDKEGRAERILNANVAIQSAEALFDKIESTEGDDQFSMSHLYDEGVEEAFPREALDTILETTTPVVPAPTGFLPGSESTPARPRKPLISDPVVRRNIRRRALAPKTTRFSDQPPQVAGAGVSMPSRISGQPWEVWHDSYLQPLATSNPAATSRDTVPPPEMTEMEHMTAMIRQQTNVMEKGFSKTIDEDLPKFAGEYRHWNNWYQNFLSLVDRNPKLPIIVKYRRMVDSLHGEALNTILHFNFEESTYELAKAALKKRYGRDEVVMFEAVRAVQSHAQVSEANIHNFIKFIDLCKQLVNTMKIIKPSLYEDASYPMLLIRQKLPVDCQTKWEQELTRSAKYGDAPEGGRLLDEYLEWLDNYAEHIRVGQIFNPQSRAAFAGGGAPHGLGLGRIVPPKTATTRPAAGNGSRSAANTTRSLDNFATVAEVLPILPKRKGKAQATTPVKCCFDGQAHASWACQNPETTKNVGASRKKAFDAGLCLNCLKPNHQARECSQPPCQVERCGKKHHRILHQRYEKPRPKPARR